MGRINDFENLDDLIPEKIYVSQEEWEGLNKILEQDTPPEVSEKLKDLFNRTSPNFGRVSEE